MKELNAQKDSNQKMYDNIIKKLKTLMLKAHLLINNGDTLTANPKEQSRLIAEYFQSVFNKNAPPLQYIPPTPMNIPFTAKEIKTAVQKIKNNKSSGNDNIKIELIKHAPYEVLEKIAEIYNNLASTGDHPNEINHGILRALQKPGKS